MQAVLQGFLNPAMQEGMEATSPEYVCQLRRASENSASSNGRGVTSVKGKRIAEKPTPSDSLFPVIAITGNSELL